MDSEGIPIGQARFDILKENKEAVISVSVDRKYRGRGYGSAMIRLASQKLFYLSETNLIHAYIKQNNEASIRAFVKAGYKEAAVTVIRGHQAIHLIFQKQGGDK
jgi:RimJ/RimL family protein N-acetyltransferase